ncbi:Glycosyltransferase involved in cell wall bisynthesis [Stigmatella aurantiaca]|uniref:Glycosyltransferase involved in cell wall bisynthesis n=1 Tax=Stigmatella aurantiaca TaxID=41 RepID=A0A1H7S356_STIAU|nr:glycosyltransferase [Stigmatella aurantiaca]SEL67022.1 Glycosyltransferase involved in cell wall bisynthesis [Stigmatella aurantiaca]
MAVHQLIPSFVAGDATGQAALHLQWLLRRMGHFGDIHAAEVGPGLESLAQPLKALQPGPEDLVLYHHGIASPLSGRLMHLPCRRGLVFHNISPARFYAGTPLAEALTAGRAQLAALAPFVDLALGVSDFNTAELRAAGYRNLHTVPLFIEPGRFSAACADPAQRRALEGLSPTVLSVSRVAPHKRFEDLIALHAELLRLRPQARLLLVGGYEPGSRYFKSLQRAAKGLSGVHFLGRLNHAELVAAYRSAQVFVSMSEHEGFGVPLLEAMAAEVPVLAFGAAAVPETLGGAGIVFDEKRFAFLAELVVELSEDEALRKRILQGQAQRLGFFSAEHSQQALEKALATVAPAPAAPRRRTAKPKRPRVAIVVQRYGEVTGGAERHAQQVAEHLAPHWNLTLLTTCAKNHLTWENVFPAGEDRVDGLPVLRFPVTRTRNIRPFNGLSRQVFDRPNERLREEHWVAEQGPLCPGLLSYLASTADTYDGYLFFTYLYAPTVWGLPLVAHRAMLVPTAHDEPPLRFGVYADVFERPRVLMCNTPEEVALIGRFYPDHARARVVGVGVDRPSAQGERFRQKHGLKRDYLLYVGRLEPGKGIPELLSHHRALQERYADAPDLVLAGDANMPLGGPGVHYVGRVSEQDKHDALAGALAVVVPSRFESLSLLTLEAFAQSTPVLVNGHSEVLAGQVDRSQAGRTYTDLESFITGLREVGEQRQALGRQGLAYAKRHGWPQVVEAYREEMDLILQEKRR